jgi:hypothetical protein
MFCFDRNCAATLPVKRLWFYLLRAGNLQDVFLRYIYRRPHKHIASDVCDFFFNPVIYFMLIY